MRCVFRDSIRLTIEPPSSRGAGGPSRRRQYHSVRDCAVRGRQCRQGKVSPRLPRFSPIRRIYGAAILMCLCALGPSGCSKGAEEDAQSKAQSQRPSQSDNPVVQPDSGTTESPSPGLAAAQRALDGSDYATALNELLPLAKQGNPYAQYTIGNMYADGQGVSQNDNEAARWWRLAADQGEAHAQFNLGNAYREGRGVPSDEKEALHWWHSAADQGLAVAQDNLGIAYAEGQGVPQDDKEAARWFRLAADQGLTRAQMRLGNMYAKGRGVPQDYIHAYMWFSVAAASGDADSVKMRDIVARLYRIPPEQIAQGERLAQEWKPKPASERR